MSIELTKVPNADAVAPEDRVVELQVIGMLRKADFDVLGPRLDVLVQQHGRLNLLIELVDFEGWTAVAAWEDVKVAVNYFNDVERIAIVGDSRWEQGMTVLAKPFTGAAVRYFGLEDKAAAKLWVQEKTG